MLFFSIFAVLGLTYKGSAESSLYTIYLGISSILAYFFIFNDLKNIIYFKPTLYVYILLPLIFLFFYFLAPSHDFVKNQTRIFFVLVLPAIFLGYVIPRKNGIHPISNGFVIAAIVVVVGVIRILPRIISLPVIELLDIFGGGQYQAFSYFCALSFLVLYRDFLNKKDLRFIWYVIYIIALLTLIIGVILSGGRGGFVVVCILWLLSPTIFAFFTWQLVSNIVYLLMSRFRLWRAISSGNSYPKANFNWQVLRNTGRFALNMASISIIGVLLTQTDKLLVSKFATLEMFSYYTIAGSLASLPIILVGAVGSALFPRFTELVALLDQVEMEKVYKKASELIGIFLIPSGLLLVFFSYEFIFAWTGSHLIAKQAGVTASLLLAGQVIQAITVLPYNLAIAHGSVRFSQKLGVYSILLITPLLVFLTMKFGIIGAGASWLILNIFTLPLNLYYLHKQKLSSKNMLKDCLRGVIRPLIITLPIMVIAKLIIPITTSRIELIGELVFVWVVSFILSSMLFSTTRSLFKVIYENISIRLKLKY